MQPFALKDFEFRIDPSIWDTAQDLHTAGSVRSLREVEPKFWVAKVDTHDFEVEVEILFSATKVKGFTCECRPNAFKMKMCPHVAATLIRLRQVLEKEKRDREKPPPEPSNRAPSRLTVLAILNHVESEQLADFVRDYAQNDRDFNLALKTRFASELPGGADFHGQLLDSLLVPLKQAKPTDADFRRLMRTLGELERQLATENEMDNFPAVVMMSMLLLRKLIPVSQRLGPPRKQHLEKLISTAFRRLSGTGLRREIAPFLEEEIWKFIFQMPENQQLIPVLEREATDYFLEKTAVKQPERLEKLETLAFEKADDEDFFLLLQLLLFQRKKELDKLLLVVERQPKFDRLLRVFHALSERGEAKLAARAARHFLETNKPGHFQARQLEDLLFQIAQKTGDIAGQMTHFRNRFLAGGSFDFYQKLKNLAADEWPDELQNLLRQLKNQESATPETARRLAVILAEEGQTAALGELLETEKDFDLMELHAGFFLRRDQKSFQKLCLKLATDHLDEFFGRQPAERIRDFLTAIRKKAPEMGVKLARELVEKFADRRAVVEELAGLLPKDEKNAWLKKVELKTAADEN